MKSKCQNCEKVFEEDQLNAVFPYIDNIVERVTPGEVVPVGECPECYSLTHVWKGPDEGVALFPGLADPECAAAAEAALEKRNHSDYQCFMLLQNSIIPELESHVSPGAVWVVGTEILEMIREAHDIIADREEHNDKFMRAVAGLK